MLFFDEDHMTKDQFECLKRTRKKSKLYKLESFSDYQMLSKRENGYSTYPENDEIFNMIENIDLEKFNFHDLPEKLKKYIREIDREVYQRNKTKTKMKNYYYQNKEIENLKRSARRAKSKIKKYVLTNENKLTHISFLTFASSENQENHPKYLDKKEEVKLKYVENNGNDFDECIIAFNNFKRRLRYRLNKEEKEFFFIMIPEQKEGKWHFQLLHNSIPSEYLYQFSSWINYDHNQQFHSEKGIKTWPYGKSQHNYVRQKKLFNLISYLSKDLVNINKLKDQPKSKNHYYRSRNLKKPTEEYLDEEEINTIVDYHCSEIEMGSYDDYFGNQIEYKLIKGK